MQPERSHAPYLAIGMVVGALGAALAVRPFAHRLGFERERAHYAAFMPSVVVAAASLPEGTTLTGGHVDLSPQPDTFVGSDVIHDPAEVAGAVLLYPVPGGAPLRPYMLGGGRFPIPPECVSGAAP